MGSRGFYAVSASWAASPQQAPSPVQAPLTSNRTAPAMAPPCRPVPLCMHVRVCTVYVCTYRLCAEYIYSVPLTDPARSQYPYQAHVDKPAAWPMVLGKPNTHPSTIPIHLSRYLVLGRLYLDSTQSVVVVVDYSLSAQCRLHAPSTVVELLTEKSPSLRTQHALEGCNEEGAESRVLCTRRPQTTRTCRRQAQGPW